MNEIRHRPMINVNKNIGIKLTMPVANEPHKQDFINRRYISTEIVDRSKVSIDMGSFLEPANSEIDCGGII